MSDQELKPCPFCGSEAFTQIFEPHSHILDFVPDHPGSATVECPNCPCGIIVDGSLEEAVNIWNTRIPDPMLEEVAGWLRRAAMSCDAFGEHCTAEEFRKRAAQVEEMTCDRCRWWDN